MGAPGQLGQLAVEALRRHKPTPEAYHSVAAALEVDPGGICLTASHVGTRSVLSRPTGRPRVDDQAYGSLTIFSGGRY
jgi:hypothetical protein